MFVQMSNCQCVERDQIRMRLDVGVIWKLTWAEVLGCIWICIFNCSIFWNEELKNTGLASECSVAMKNGSSQKRLKRCYSQIVVPNANLCAGSQTYVRVGWQLKSFYVIKFYFARKVTIKFFHISSTCMDADVKFSLHAPTGPFAAEAVRRMKNDQRLNMNFPTKLFTNAITHYLEDPTIGLELTFKWAGIA